jgi:hypothetical protein
MAFDKDKPASSTSLRASNPEILANWDALETALNREHEYSTGGTVADQAHHKKGSARCFIQDAVPTTRRDTTAFTAEDNGSLWIDTNSSPDNQFNVLTDYSGPTWTPISTEVIAVLLAANRIFAGTLKSTGDFTVGANKVVVTAASGNTVIAGTLGAAGIATLGDGSKMATSAAPGADAELANKKYVDDALGQSSQVTGTNDISNTSGNWADIANMSITITTKGGNVLLTFSASIKISAFNAQGELRFDEDGTPRGTWFLDYATGSLENSETISWLITSLSAAAHTFKVQWKDTNGTIEQLGNTRGARAFSAIELPS